MLPIRPIAHPLAGMGDLVDERLTRSIEIVAKGYGLDRLPERRRSLIGPSCHLPTRALSK
ncbi:hypothetical protein [uncultured Marivita sp.]|uniref:hypothetical protein n=1 Tax=uncultured Marivita sp. TaxID=888080 RepID=UPI002628D546|nr:hypothetical protein [uncultured Marivita sp.]